MRRYITLLIVAYTLLQAQTVTLDEFIQNVQQLKLLDKSIKQEADALEAEVQSDIADEPFVLSHYISKIGTSVDNLKNGIDTSLSKEMRLGDIKELEERMYRLSNESYILSKKEDVIALKNELLLVYHQYCLGESYLNSYQNYYSHIKELYRKKKIAYEHNDIAKTELLQVEFEKDRQNRELKNLIRKQQNIKETLLALGGYGLDDSFVCSDLYPIKGDIDLDTNELFPISKEVYKKEQDSIKVGVQRYSKKLESLNLSLGYNHEVDTDFYTVGVELPLNFTSRKNEYKKASLLYQYSANETKHHLSIKQRELKLKEVQSQLKNISQEILGIEDNIRAFQAKLMPLIQKSYDYGESSVMEYLLTQQKLNILQRELLDAKERYYKRLFRLYTLSQREDI